jgi:predicted AlkP superfamily phosphohydrolase/phosphomutase
MLDHMDAVIGKLLDRADENTLVVLASDHGFGDFIGKVKPNNLLRDWGYFQQRSPLGYLAARIRRNLRRTFVPKIKRRRRARDLGDRLAIDWSKTQAFAAMANHHAYVYLNLAGRDPHGCVPANRYDALIEELRRKFAGVRDPQNGQALFSAVYRPEELYGLTPDDSNLLPDLIAVAAEGYVTARAIHGDGIIDYAKDNFGGCHRPRGLYVLAGAAVKQNHQAPADIADIVPTLYAFLGAPLPAVLDGAIIQHAFETPLQATQETPAAAHAPAQRYDVSQNEQDLIQQRLADLGYLE